MDYVKKPKWLFQALLLKETFRWRAEETPTQGRGSSLFLNGRGGIVIDVSTLVVGVIAG
jgi:hypothetical protein